MNDEIKEILNRLEKIGYYASVPKELAYMTTNITPQECKTILDYITNLQQEIEKLNDDKRGMLVELYKANDKKDKYKSRIEKAVEYIEKEHEWIKNIGYKLLKTEDLLNILNGKE